MMETTAGPHIAQMDKSASTCVNVDVKVEKQKD